MTTTARTQALVLMTGVWDVVDLLEDWLRYHRSIGVEGVLAMDYGSTDGCLDVLGASEWLGFVTLVPFSGMTSNKNLAMTEHLRRTGSDAWAMCIDPDEFLVTESGDLGSLPVAGHGAEVLTIPRYDMSAARSVAEQATDLRPSFADLDLRYVERDQGKVMVDLSSAVTPSISGHEAEGPGALAVDVEGMCLLHAPVRSYRKFVEKVDHAAVTLEANPQLPEGFAWHWRRWIRIRDEGGLREEYLAQFVSDELVSSVVADGTYARDGRLAAVLQRSRAAMDQ